ncbi:ABC transporter ATP-binding protein [Desulfospira joergensenii]|uniref:ABC transporter ATP-binding protein n=1 Tax=Desulfospira joergensenii TaxID=53329 RepID=UPI0003B62C04|nr:ABC transporter ATP-binding protein [Desulfospira joergensenii]
MKLHIKDLDFSYGKQPVLKAIGMDLNRSELLGVVGPNGSGKSTLIRCIDGILKPGRGSIILNGKDLAKMPQLEVARNLGYVPQNAPKTFPVTVFDAVLMGRRPHLSWRSGEKDRSRVVEALKRLSIEHLALRDFNELSGGEQQRVLIARALAQEADVLLLDEPTSNLDIRHQLEVMEIMRQLVAEKDLSAVIAIHDLNLASRYADRVVMMKEGKVFAAGDPAQVFTPSNIASVYGVESIVEKKNGSLFIIPQKPVAS